MKVLQINTVYGTGSTGRIVMQLKHQIEKENGRCMAAYGRGRAEEKGTYRIGSDIEVYSHALITRISDRTGFHSVKATERLIEEIKKFSPDVIHLHNLHGYYLNIRVLFAFLKHYKRPVVWTLHDCWPFTGHCAYYLAAKCEKWKEQCQDCMNKKEYPASYLLDNSRMNFKEKQELFTSLKNMTIITPSEWLAKEIKDSFLKEYPVRVIPNGVDTDIFAPVLGDMCESIKNLRQQYNLQDKKIILGVASIWSERKGLKDFIKIAEKLDNKYIIVLVGLEKKQQQQLPENIVGIGRTNDVKELALLYSEAAVFINPTYEDNFPAVNLEALACGTPVITYDTGGSPEALDDKTGICVKAGDIEGLLTAIEQAQLLKREDCVKRGKLFDSKGRYAEYISLYREVSEAESKPEVSIIIPTYGRPVYLKRAIASVQKQTFKNWELIVVDDNEPESDARKETEKLMQDYSDTVRIRYIRHDKNKNGAAARNTGIHAASGKYITFLDDDDEYVPDRLGKCIRALENHTNVSYAAVYTGCEFRKDGKKYSEYVKVKSGNFLTDTLKCTFMLCSGSNIFVKADIVRELKGFDETFLRHQDYEFMVRFFRKYDLLAIPELLLVKNQLNTNVPDAETMYGIKLHFWKRFREDIEKHDIVVRNKIYFSGYVQLMEYAIRNGNRAAYLKFQELAKKHGRISFENRLRMTGLAVYSLLKK